MASQSVWSWEAGQYIDAPPPDVSGPLPGAIDASAACTSLGYALALWQRRILPLGETAYRYLDESDEYPPGAITCYQHEQQRRQAWEDKERSLYESRRVDRRPYFQDPQPLSFDPIEVFARDEGEGNEKKVKLSEVWADPIARTIWIAIKSSHLTSQYFRGACVEQAAWFRRNPPRLADDLRLSTGDGYISQVGYWCNVQVWPYVVYELQQEGRWPYFDIPRLMRVDHSLGWKVNKEIR